MMMVIESQGCRKLDAQISLSDSSLLHPYNRLRQHGRVTTNRDQADTAAHSCLLPIAHCNQCAFRLPRSEPSLQCAACPQRCELSSIPFMLLACFQKKSNTHKTHELSASANFALLRACSQFTARTTRDLRSRYIRLNIFNFSKMRCRVRQY